MNSIRIWRFEDAPEELSIKSINGGDEDWVALIPVDFVEKHGIPNFLDEGGSFGVCSVDKFKKVYYEKEVYTMLIGSHA